MAIVDRVRGDVYALLAIPGMLVTSRYDEDGQNVTPEEFAAKYRKYHKLGMLRRTKFGRPWANGCRVFLTDSQLFGELQSAAIFVPSGVEEREWRQMLENEFRTKVHEFAPPIAANQA